MADQQRNNQKTKGIVKDAAQKVAQQTATQTAQKVAQQTATQTAQKVAQQKAKQVLQKFVKRGKQQKEKQIQLGLNQFAVMKSQKQIQDLNKAQKDAKFDAAMAQAAQLTRRQKQTQVQKNAQDALAGVARMIKKAQGDQQQTTTLGSAAAMFQKAQQEALKQAARKKICDQLKKQRVLK